MRSWVIGAIIVAVATAVGSGIYLYGLTRPAEASEVVLGWSPCACFEPVMVAEEKGIFKRYGLNVTYERFPAFFPITEAMIAGKIDGGIINPVFAINAAAGTGEYVKLIYPLNHVGTFEGERFGPQAFVVTESNSELTSVSQFREKKIGVGTLNDVGHVALLEELTRAGVDPKDVQFVQIPHPQMEGAIVNKEVDAGLIIYPFITYALDRETVKIIAPNIDDVLNRTVISWLGANREFVEKNPETTEKLIKSLAEAAEWMNDSDNENERYDIISKWTNIPVETVKKMGLRTQYFGVYADGFKDYEGYLKPWNELMMKYGLQSRLVEFERFDPKTEA
jgi:NitT/TauT family transport system substrate-binding protein